MLVSPMDNLPALTRAAPPLPKQPVRLFRILGEYACALFNTEAGKYPISDELESWLRGLAERVEVRAVNAALQDSLWGTLTYHATREEMRAAVHKVLESH